MEVPKVKFPILTLLVTGKHSEIVLTRGVGLHTIIGMTIDVAAGNCIDKSSNKFMHYRDILSN